jgi:hypothetical protein
LDKTSRLYIGVMAVLGAALGVADIAAPGWTGGVPPLLFLLGAGLAMDILINQQAKAGKWQPLTMQGRFLGFFIGAATSILIPMLSGRA